MPIIKKHIYTIPHYKPPLEGRNSKNFLLLDFNERTIPVPEYIKKSLIDFINSDELHVYPSYHNISEKIANYCDVETDEILITNGSDQGIDLVIRACVEPGSEVIIPAPCFPIYEQSALVEGAKIVSPNFTYDNGFPVNEILDSISNKTSCVVIPNPNNPTGTLVSRKDILKIAKKAEHCAILVDECYYEYSKVSVAEDINIHPNLFITRTFSKTWGMPSLRIGYIISDKDNCIELSKIRGPYDVNKLAVVAINKALEDSSYMQAHVDEVLNISKPMLEDYFKSNNIKYWESYANFLFVMFSHPLDVERKLRTSGVLVRPKADDKGKLGLRITVGNKKQTEKLISLLETI